MNIASGVTTCNRKGVNYLFDTLDSLIEAGFTDGSSYSDGDGELGSYGNFRRTIRALVENNPLADAVAVFQDDINVSRNLRAWLDETLWPGPVTEIGVVSLYTSRFDAVPERGWRKLPLGEKINDCGGKRWALGNGALGLIFPMRSAMFFLADEPHKESRTRTDMIVGQWCEQRGLAWWSHNPSLISHRGEVSTLSSVGLIPDRREAEFADDCRDLPLN